jgi:hypothetical protein
MKAADRKEAFSAAAWLDESLAGGILWTIAPDGGVWQCMSEPYIDPLPPATWERLRHDYERFKSQIVAEMRRRIGPGPGSLYGPGCFRWIPRPQGCTRVGERHDRMSLQQTQPRHRAGLFFWTAETPGRCPGSSSSVS